MACTWVVEPLDAFEGPEVTIGLAEIYAMLGDADSAMPLLEHSISVRVGIAIGNWRLDPV